MAKLKKRVLQNKKQLVDECRDAKAGELREQMAGLVQEERYADAMDVMAEMAEMGGIDTETMYMGAFCYYATGDCERAVRWVNNVLTRDPDNIRAHLLLGRICIAEDRCEEGLRILDAALGRAASELNSADRIALEDDLYYYKYTAPEKVAGFSHIQAFLGLQPAADEILVHNESNGVQVEGEGEEKSAQQLDITALIRQIMEKTVSLQEKIKLFNAFAAGCYQKKDYVAAESLLEAALRIDASNKILLQNMMHVCVARGKLDKALEFASQVPMIDFSCLNIMKG